LHTSGAFVGHDIEHFRHDKLQNCGSKWTNVKNPQAIR
jgi:hypothetical protein